MRYSELTGLTRKDFDFQNNIIRVDKTWDTEKESGPGFGPTKNYEKREIVMTDSIMQAFKELFESTPTNLHQLVFYSAQSKYHVISNNNINKIVRKVLGDLGIEKITSHGLRHTHASILIFKKVSLEYVSDRLGHKDVQTTSKTYIHFLKAMREEDEESTLQILHAMETASKKRPKIKAS